MPTTLGLFDVMVMQTAAAIRCQLEIGKADRYRLQFIENGIIVKEKSTNQNEHGQWRQIFHLRYE